jgi:hypothetical protein
VPAADRMSARLDSESLDRRLLPAWNAIQQRDRPVRSA